MNQIIIISCSELVPPPNSYVACIRVRIYYIIRKLLLSHRGRLENTNLTFVELTHK